MPSVMQSFMAANSQTMVVNPGENIPEPELEVQQVERNVHGFRNRSSSQRSSSCPVAQHIDPDAPRSKPELILPRSKHDRNRAPPHPDDEPIPTIPNPPNPIPQTPGSASANLGGNVSAGPQAFYIGEKGVGKEDGEGGKGGDPDKQAKLIREQHERREEEKRVRDDPMGDPWNTRQAEHARGLEREKRERDARREAVRTEGQWSQFTGTTHSVGQANPGMQQHPFVPQISRFPRPGLDPGSSSGLHPGIYPNLPEPPYPSPAPACHPFHQHTPCANAVTHSAWPTYGPNTAVPPLEPSSYVAGYGFSTSVPPLEPSSYVGTSWQQENMLWKPNPTQPFANTFARSNMFGVTSPNTFMGDSTEFQPAGEYQQHVPQISLPFQQQFQCQPNINQCIQGLRSKGTDQDRAQSSDFRPPEMSGPSVAPHASSHEFCQRWGPGLQQLFSPLGNPVPVSQTQPLPYTVAPPAIPQSGHCSGHGVIPNNISFRDFTPSAFEQWEQQDPAGQSSSFYGLHTPAWKSECRAVGSAPAAFNYAHIPVAGPQFGETRGMFGEGWGEDVGDEEARAEEMAFDHDAFRAPDVFQTPLNSRELRRPDHMPSIPERQSPAYPPSPWTPQCRSCHCSQPPIAMQCQPSFPDWFGRPQGDSPRPPFPDFPGRPQGDSPRPPPPTFYPGNPGQQPPDQFGGHGPFPPGPFGPGPPGPPGPFRPGPPGYPGPHGPPPPGPFVQQCQPCQQNRNNKRWIPPPAFTPNSATGPSYKAWLWTLAAWARLTAMPWEDRALAVGLSLGGRARTLVQSIPHGILHCRTGLATLLQRMEEEFGSELQDRVKASSQSFDSFRRGKHMGAAEYLAAFEASYQNSVDHGLYMSPQLLAIRLLERANLSPSQEDWILQAVGGDYTNYQGLRRALRRLPSLTRETTNAFPVNSDSSQTWVTSAPENLGNYSPFSAPPPEPFQPPPDSLDEDTFSCSDWSDDYCSTGSGDETEGMMVQQAWAQLRVFRKRKGKGKSGGGKGKGKRRRGKGGKKGGTFIVLGEEAFPIAQRNVSNEIPQGWTAEKWLAREPCPGCGSRYHRNCTQQSGQTKGHMKGKGKSKGPSGFAVFMLTAAALLGQAQSLFLPFVPIATGDTVNTTAACMIDAPLQSLPREPVYNMPVFPIEHLPVFSENNHEEYLEFLNAADNHQTFVGLEPFGSEYRDMRYTAFASDVKSRYALMLDTGAPQTCCGMNWLTRFIEDMKITSETWSPFQASLSGIGSGSATVRWKVSCPIGVDNYVPTLLCTQVLEGIGKSVPCLFGLSPMTKLNAVIDLRDRTITLDTPSGERRKLVCHTASGHMLLPIDWGGTDLKTSREKFIADPLGLALWLVNETKPDEEQEHLIPGTLPMFSCFSEEQVPIPCFPCFQELPPGLSPEPVPGENECDSPAYVKIENLSFSQKKLPQGDTSAVEMSSMHPAFVAMVNRTHSYMTKLAKKELLMSNSTYRKKYQPFPKDTPVPLVDVAAGIWDVWELWAGCAGITKACQSMGMKCGPPITKEKGWDISLKTHQAAIWKLFEKHRPHILWAAPTCGPWSQSNTNMNTEVKKLLREEQMEAFSFYSDMVAEQHHRGEDQVLEQPRSSELLRQPSAERMKSKYEAEDYVTCMCCHGLADPESKRPFMKQTTLRSTLKLRRSVKWCKCTVPHQQMQGHTRGGLLRTASAQTYTKLFCTRVAGDFLESLKSKGRPHSAFPADDDLEGYTPNPSYRPRDPGLAERSDEELENPKARSDPYLEETVEEIERKADRVEAELKRSRLSRHTPVMPQYSVPKAKILPRPKEPVIEVEDREPEPRTVELNPSDGKAPEPPGQIDDLPPDPDAQQLQLAVKKPVLDSSTLSDIAKAGLQLPNGAQRTFQTGPKFKLMQELFATPSQKKLRLMILTRRPAMIACPEPLVSRTMLSHFLHLTQDTADSTWQSHGWREISELTSVPRGLVRKPAWSFVLFALQAEEGDLAEHLQSTTLETLTERAELDHSNSSSLSSVLRVLTEGDQPAVMRMLLSLHKRLYHRKAPELRAILNRSGIPGKVLSLVEDAIGLCAECRRWASTHAAPAIKTNLSSSFNRLVYADLIFISDPPLIFLVMLDDCIRWIMVQHVLFKDFGSLTEAMRRCWFSIFGPPETLRSDKESALAHDSFAIFLEAVGVKRELILAKDSHSMLGPLDRKIKILRLAAPRIVDSLLQDSIKLSPEDLASELQYAANTQLTYGGVSPYNCLFGTHPKEFWSDESDDTSSSDVKLPFFEMIHVRQKAVAAFHQALLRFRLEKSVKSRPRSDQSQQYVVGQLVDIFIKAGRKDLEGWRGPGVLLGFCGEGRATVRWQSTVRDLPYNLIRPFVSVLNPGVGPTTAAISNPAPAPAVLDAPERASSSSDIIVKRQTTPVIVPPRDMPLNVEPVETHAVLRNNFEVYFNVSSADQLRSPFLSTLMSIASSLEVGQQQLHTFEVTSPTPVWSKDALRDDKVVFGIGKKLAEANGVKNYAGVILQSARRYLSFGKGILRCHAIAWTNPQFMRVVTAEGQNHIDWIQQGVCTFDDLHMLRTLVCLEAHKESPLLQTLLETAPAEVDTIVEGRVREQWFDEDIAIPQHTNDEITDAGPSISERDANEVFLARVETASVLRRDLDVNKIADETQYFPLDKDSRPLTDAEIQSMAPEVRQSKLKELTSWVKNKAGKPRLKKEYTQRTGLKPLPTRWVGTFKRKKGVKIVKQRLVGKGFAEANQASLETSSPTATRTGHRMVMSTAARKHWEIHSLDISAAFLKGFDFDKLRELGHARQPVALNVTVEIFKLLAELDKETWQIAADNPEEYCIELVCGAYGLKDGPLLWFIRFVAALTDHGMKQSVHDPCVFMVPLSAQEMIIQKTEIQATGVAVNLIMSLHVDDTLASGTLSQLTWLEKFLIEEFEDVTCEKNAFRHFGVDVFRHPTLFHIFASQVDYIAELKEITLPNRSRKETECDANLITAFRSLVSGIAWVGVTYAPALAAASLYQSFLPKPTHEHCRMMNGVLAQIRAEYVPLVFRGDLRGPFRLVVIGDSSLGNSSKYSQGGFFILLAEKSDTRVCGHCHPLAFKSGKSKRVASSTEHAEVLACLAGIEEALFLQTWMYEIAHPYTTSLQLLSIPGNEHVQILSITDCLDVLESLIKTAVPTPVNRALTLYLHALRELYQKKFVEAYIWCDTRDNIANALTKLKPDGTLDLGDLKEFYRGGGWEPKQPFRWHSSRLSDPDHILFAPLPLPPPSTKQVADYKLRDSDKKEISSMLPSLQYRFVYVTIEIELPLDWT